MCPNNRAQPSNWAVKMGVKKKKKKKEEEEEEEGGGGGGEGGRGGGGGEEEEDEEEKGGGGGEKEEKEEEEEGEEEEEEGGGGGGEEEEEGEENVPIKYFTHIGGHVNFRAEFWVSCGSAMYRSDQLLSPEFCILSIAARLQSIKAVCQTRNTSISLSCTLTKL